MDKTEIKSIMIGDEILFSKSCPFNVNYLNDDKSFSVVRKVGSEKCKECDSFIKIENNFVYCK